MSTPKKHKPVKLVASLLSAEKGLINEGISQMMALYGEADFTSGFGPFDLTDYYHKELGFPLLRRFVAFRKPILPESIATIKLRTNDIERSFSRDDGSRRLNIDPGYIAPQHFILATCKGFAHRPYLGQGVYADLTLVFRDGHYHPLEWTYPDYASAATREMLEKIRKVHMLRLEGEPADD